MSKREIHLRKRPYLSEWVVVLPHSSFGVPDFKAALTVGVELAQGTGWDLVVQEPDARNAPFGKFWPEVKFSPNPEEAVEQAIRHLHEVMNGPDTGYPEFVTLEAFERGEFPGEPGTQK